ncbi:hypothetical protein REPUB_Repub12eG0032500 [Reevesia pubescens]
MVARALTRKGTALVKMAKTSKDYESAIEAFQKALTELRNPDVWEQGIGGEGRRDSLSHSVKRVLWHVVFVEEVHIPLRCLTRKQKVERLAAFVFFRTRYAVAVAA